MIKFIETVLVNAIKSPVTIEIEGSLATFTVNEYNTFTLKPHTSGLLLGCSNEASIVILKTEDNKVRKSELQYKIHSLLNDFGKVLSYSEYCDTFDPVAVSCHDFEVFERECKTLALDEGLLLPCRDVLKNIYLSSNASVLNGAGYFLEDDVFDLNWR